MIGEPKDRSEHRHDLQLGGRRDANGNYLGYGGAGCASYDLDEYASQLRTLWKDEPLPGL